MQQLREYCETLTVPDPINFAAGDLRLSVERALHEEYAGRCYQGAFITRIAEVLNVGRMYISMDYPDPGVGTLSVRFLAEVRVFASWDPIMPVRVSMAAPLVIGGYTEPGADGAPGTELAVSANTGSLQVAVGDLIPVRLIQVF